MNKWFFSQDSSKTSHFPLSWPGPAWVTCLTRKIVFSGLVHVYLQHPTDAMPDLSLKHPSPSKEQQDLPIRCKHAHHAPSSRSPPATPNQQSVPHAQIWVSSAGLLAMIKPQRLWPAAAAEAEGIRHSSVLSAQRCWAAATHPRGLCCL